MNLFRLLILGLVTWMVIRVLRSWGSSSTAPRKRPSPEQYELMARCRACGVFMPRDTVGDDGRCRQCVALRR